MAGKASNEAENTLYRIECPLCGATSLHLDESGASGTSAIDYLRAHISSTNGDGHGPEYTLPDDFDETSLENHINPI